MKNKIQSYVGMRLGGRRLIDTLTTHLSPTNHPLKHGIGKYIFSFLLVLAMSIGQMWGAYAPTADEVIILKDVYNASGTGYSNHSAIAWAASGASTNSKKAGDPNNGGAATSSNVPCYSVKGNGGTKNITVSITGCSQIILYHEKHSSRYVELRDGSKTGTLIGKGSASTYYTEVDLTGATVYSIFLHGTTGSDDQDFNIYAIKLIKATGGGGGDPVDPTITFNDGAYTIGAAALDLSTLFSSNSDGAVTYSIKTDGGTSASISGANFSATAAGTATVTATQAAGTGYNAGSAEANIVVSEPDPCNRYFWFVATADATANGKTNWDGFTNAVTGSNNQSNSVTIDGTTYTLTKRTGSTGGGGTILGFTIPADKAGTLYGYMKSSGTAARVLSLKKGDDVVMTNDEIGTGGNWTLITMSNIAPGTYTLSPDQNVQVQMFVLKICDATFHTITLNLDGGTGATSVQALDGVAATKPADPTKEHCAFAGWYKESVAYDWSTVVTEPFTLTAHWTQLYTISFAAGDGSGDAPAAVADKAKDETFEVPANTFTAPEGKEFDKWNDGANDYAPGATYTVGTANVVLTAQWKALTAKYTVIFKDGETTLDIKLFEVGSNPSDADIDKTKPLYTFAAWQKDAADIALDDAYWASVAANAEITLNARWAKAYASNADFEAYIIANKDEKDDADKAEAYVKSLNYALSTKTNTTFDANDETNNGAYAGLKIKNSGTTLSWNVVADKVVELKAGVMVANGSLSINGGAATTIDGGSTSSGDNFKMHYFYSAAEALYVFTTSNNSAEVIKAITMRDPYQVSFNDNGGCDPIAAQDGTPSVTLPTPVNPTANFTGWYDAATEGNKIGDAGDTYTPTADIELFAQWETVSTDARLASISFSSDAGTLEPTFDPEVVNYTYTMPYGTAAVPTITGAISVNANAKTPVIDAQAANWGDVAHIHGVAESDDTKDYYITMKIAPKDGVCLVWADVPADNTLTYNATNSKFYAESDVTLQNSNVKGKDGSAPSGKKFQSNGFLKIALNEGTFLEGDVVALNVTYGTANVMHVFKAQAATSTDVIGEAAGNTDAGLNKVAITEDAATLWLVRGGEYADWNPHVDYVAVYRAMNPLLKAITINGETGTINEGAKTVAVELQPGYDLAALTINTTIISNTPEADVVKTVESNSGNWVIGDNTYRLTDKDGDYTEYTVTLIAGELKHNVSFNTHGGSTIDPVQVVDGQKLTAAPADPTKDDYLFQGWAETEDGSIVDVTSFTISADKEFHAVWAPDGAIKLLNGATVNHTNFITGVTADETVEFQGNEVHYAKFSGTVSGVNGVKDLTRVIAYNATTNKTKIQISAHNNSTSGRSILVKGLVEGASAAVDLATIALGNKEDKVSEWIEFNNAANRTIYIMVSSSAGDVYFTQVKVIESGETPMKQAGEAGYSLNLNKGRFFGLANTDLSFEGLNARLSGDYTALNSGYAKLNATSMSFTVASDMLLTVTANNNKTYYVTKDAAGTDNETAKTGASEFNLTAGTWFITAGTAEVQLTDIAFALPKCEQPTVVDMESIGLCEGDEFIALTVSASVSDEGTLHYAWFKEAGATDEAVGTDAASFTPEADGEYYVIVTNQKTGYSDNSETSNTVSVEHFAAAIITTAPADVAKEVGQEATLSVVATGKNCTYEWFTCDDALGTNPVAIVPAETEASLTVTVAAGEQYYMVVVSSDCGASVSAVAKVAQWRELAPANVTGSMTWDWKSAAWDGITGDIAFANTGVEELMANVNAKVPCVDGANGFRSDMLYGTGQYVWRPEGNRFFQGTKIRFITTVPGKLVVRYRNTSGSTNTRTIKITNNGEVLPADGTNTTNSFKNTNPMVVKAGEVIIEGIASEENGLTRIEKIIFDADLDPTQAEEAKLGGYERDVTEGRYGTICLPKAGIMVGAAIFELAYYSESDNKIFMDQVMSGEMVAGRPYIFLPNEGVSTLGVYYTDHEAVAAGDYRGLYGYYNGTDDALQLDPGDGHYILYNNQFREVTVSHVWIDQNRAYFKIGVAGGIPTNVVAPLPGRRRMSIGAAAPQVTTGMDELNAGEAPVKVLINGELFIFRGDKMFDATGRLVK